jgi:hypothetical protein
MPFRLPAVFVSLALGLFALPAFAEDAWETIAPGGETSCALGTPYSFHARKADPEKLVVFFNGGGACWAGQTCDPAVEPTTYVPSAQMSHNDPRTHKGIFDLDNPANPVGDWSMVFVSYCTGDVHLGETDKTYTKPDGSETTIRHRGHVNAHAALTWMKENIGGAKQVLVAGSSAGAIAAPVYAGVVSKIYPDARVQQLGDGAGGYSSPEIGGLLATWGVIDILPDWLPLDTETVTSFNALYEGAAAAFPEISFAQYDAAHDGMQIGFQQALQGGTALHEQMIANRGALRDAIPGFVSFTAGGAQHTILRAPYLYSYSVNGTSFVDWLGALVAGEKPETVDCAAGEDGCDSAPS